MRIIIAILILINSNSILAQKKATNLLKTAYEKKSDEYLKEFFELWRKEVKPIKKNELLKLNDTIKCAYKAFEAFYNPIEIGKIRGPEWGDSIYRNVQYYIVQNSVAIKIANFRIIDTANKKFINAACFKLSDARISNIFRRKNVFIKHLQQHLECIHSPAMRCSG